MTFKDFFLTLLIFSPFAIYHYGMVDTAFAYIVSFIGLVWLKSAGIDKS